MESTGRGEAVSTWKSKASLEFKMIMMHTRLLYLSCVDRWRRKFKPMIDGCSIEEWTLEEVIICIIYMEV